MKNVLLVGLGGFLGSMGRYVIGILSTVWFGGVYPLGTLTVNLVGSLLIGLLAGYFAHSPNSTAYLLMVTGFCGGFTTFSALSLEGINLLKTGEYTLYFIYAAGSLAGGLLLCMAGFWIIKQVLA